MSVKITKFVHSCLLLELPESGQSVLFDPGEYSPVPVEALPGLDDIIITHQHPDHMDPVLIKKLRSRFPNVRITAPADAATVLAQAGITGAQTSPGAGMNFFKAPHEGIKPLGMIDPPQENGVHYHHILTHPGDSHHFHETMPILALPVTASWGSAVEAARVALAVRPQYIVPVHDWHWHDRARAELYERMEKRFGEVGIHFLKMTDGEAVIIPDLVPHDRAEKLL